MMKREVLILDGPNLNRLGRREPALYGTMSSEEWVQRLISLYPEVKIHYKQSNHEGALIDMLQEADDAGTFCGVILNAGGYTHTSVALADAVRSLSIPVIEVHITQPAAREPFRHTSLLAPAVRGSISGFGVESYHLALLSLLRKL